MAPLTGRSGPSEEVAEEAAGGPRAQAQREARRGAARGGSSHTQLFLAL